MNRFQATWISPSSIAAFRNCELAYYYANVYKDPVDNKKISSVSPHLTLGNCVHSPLENLAHYKPEQRKNVKFAPEYRRMWKENSGQKGGFKTQEEEDHYHLLGETMLKRVRANIHHLEKPTTFLLENENALPNMVLSETEQIILSGKIDWISVTGENTYSVLDFKTGKNTQPSGDLQLPIYKILMDNYFKSGENVEGAFWYLLNNDDPTPRQLPPLKDCVEEVMNWAIKIKTARARKEFHCPNEGRCFYCRDYKRIVNNDNVLFTGVGLYGSKNYLIL